LPAIQRFQSRDDTKEVIIDRAHLENTVRKIKDRFYAPHGASRAKKYDLIRHKKSAVAKTIDYRSFSPPMSSRL
jgi:hypothetical protein